MIRRFDNYSTNSINFVDLCFWTDTDKLATTSRIHNLPTSHHILPNRQIYEPVHLPYQRARSRHARIICRLREIQDRNVLVGSHRTITEKKRTSEPLIRREEARGKEEPISRRPTSRKQLPFRPPAALTAAAMVSGGMREASAEQRKGWGFLRGFFKR